MNRNWDQDYALRRERDRERGREREHLVRWILRDRQTAEPFCVGHFRCTKAPECGLYGMKLGEIG